MSRVTGFAISGDLNKVTLIKRDGCYAALSGNVKKGEEPSEAIYRLFYEMTGVEITRWSWLGRLKTLDQDHTDYYVAQRGNSKLYAAVHDDVQWVPIKDISRLKLECLNLTWVVPLARLKFLDLPNDQRGIFTSS